MYLDTSALAALYIPEARSEAVAAAVRRSPPAISSLVEVEFASVVARRLRERTLAAEDGARVLGAFDEHIAERRFRHQPVVAGTFSAASRLLRGARQPLATLDALHLALVIAARESLCTADRQLARAAAGAGVDVRLIRL